MRCPHCDGEIHDGSRFCGICGRQLASAGAGLRSQQPAPKRTPASATGQPQTASPPSSPPVAARSAKAPHIAARAAPIKPIPNHKSGRARTAITLLLDVILISAGGWMIASYGDDCERAQRSPTSASERSLDPHSDNHRHHAPTDTELNTAAEPSP